MQHEHKMQMCSTRWCRCCWLSNATNCCKVAATAAASVWQKGARCLWKFVILINCVTIMIHDDCSSLGGTCHTDTDNGRQHNPSWANDAQSEAATLLLSPWTTLLAAWQIANKVANYFGNCVANCLPVAFRIAFYLNFYELELKLHLKVLQLCLLMCVRDPLSLTAANRRIC